MLGLLLAETSPAEAEKFMAMLPAIARFAWKAGARRGYAPHISRHSIDRVHGDALL